MAFVLLVDVEIAPGNEQACLAAMLKNAEASRNEPGNLTFDVIAVPDSQDRKYKFYEVYKDEKAFEAHQATEHFKEWLANGVPMLAHRQRHVLKRVSP